MQNELDIHSKIWKMNKSSTYLTTAKSLGWNYSAGQRNELNMRWWQNRWKLCIVQSWISMLRVKLFHLSMNYNFALKYRAKENWKKARLCKVSFAYRCNEQPITNKGQWSDKSHTENLSVANQKVFVCVSERKSWMLQCMHTTKNIQ